MRDPLQLSWSLALALCIAIGGGYLGTSAPCFGASPQDEAKLDLLKRLVETRAGIETGLSVAELRKSERDVRAAFALAAGGFSDAQRRAVENVLIALHQTVSAWEETFSRCHGEGSDYVALYGLRYGCDNEVFLRAYTELGVLSEFQELASLSRLPPKRGIFLQPLFRVVLDRIQTAIDSLPH